MKYAILLILMVSSGVARADGDADFLFRLRRDFSAPLRGQSPFILGSGAALTAFALRVEDPGANRRSLDGSSFDALMDVGNEFGGGRILAPLAVGAWAGGALLDRPGLSDFGVDLSSALIAVSGYTWALKGSLDRSRPNGGPHSFPSGHTAAAFATAAVIDRHAGPITSFVGYSLAASTMGGRMEENRHYLSDVVFGAALGLSVGGARLPILDREWMREHIHFAGKGVSFRAAF